MIKHTGPEQAPTSSASPLDSRTPEQPAHLSSNQQDQLNLQELSLPSSLMQAAQVSEELATRTVTPAQVVEKGTRAFDTGLRIEVEALTIAA